MDDRLTPEERAVIEAAVAWADAEAYDGLEVLEATIAAYRKATAPPEPFERFLYRYTDGTWSTTTYEELEDTPDIANTWRCTITPTERVR